MPHHWTYRSIPELANLPPHERRRLIKYCRWKPFRQVKVWCQFILLILLFSAFSVGLVVIAFPLLFKSIPFVTMFLTLASIDLLAVFFSINALTIHHLRPLIRAQLSNLCFHCGYDLRASPTRCPECGTPCIPHRHTNNN